MKLLTAYFLLSFYVLGALVIENDANYPTWYHIDAGSFGAYHRALESRLQLFLFTPMALQLVVNGWLIWATPPGLPRWAFVLTFLLNGYVIAESLLVQVPIHQRLEQHYATDLIDQLITYHRTFRLPAELLAGGINSWLLHRCFRFMVR